jgi:hypothetical protein
MEWPMARADSFWLMVTSIKENGFKIRPVVTVDIIMQMAQLMKVNGKTTVSMAKVKSDGWMVACTRGSTKTV